MPFIWNGSEYDVVDDEELEDYWDYVVSRRLFVSLLDPNRYEVKTHIYLFI